ncbi:hypothetical protein EPO66_01945 [bacterium]|nr:MAG: hypothetical protein EPO66_01945 [bacterium]
MVCSSGLYTLINLAPLVIVVMAIILFISIEREKNIVILKKLDCYLPGYVPKLSFYSSYKGEYKGLKVIVELIPRGKNSPSYLNIYLFKEHLFKLRIYKENTLTDLGKKIGLLKEIKVGDESFDNEFMLTTDNPDMAKSYLYNQNLKNNIRELFARGFTSVSINYRRILISKPNYNLETDLDPKNVMDVINISSVF